LQFNIVAARLVGAVKKAVPSELIGSAKVVLSAGHGIIQTELVPSAKKGEEDVANFEARLWQPGVYEVELSYGSLRQSCVFLGTVTVKPGAKGTIEQTFELPARELAGFVVNEEGVPVAGAEVHVGTDEHGLSFETEACVTSSDASGAWRCRWLPEGKLLLVARKEGAGASGIEAVDAGAVGAAVTVHLAAGATVSGELAVAEGADPTEAPVGFSCEVFPALLVQGRTDRGGAFALTDLPRCDGQLIVRPKDKALAFVWRQVTAGPPTDLGELKAELAGGVFAVGSDEAPPGVNGLLGKWLYYRGTRFCGKLFGGIGGVGTGYPKFPGGPGYFYKLPPGSYRLEWLDLDRKVVARSAAFEVGAGEMREVSFNAR
jgi:hypothetical protein